MKTLDWEVVPQSNGSYMERAKTPTGWLVRETHDVNVDLHGNGRIEPGYEWRVALTFVPDPTHEWLAT